MGIAPTINIKGTLMGTDKWEHFFQQGYWAFDAGMNDMEAHAYGFWLEGDPTSRGRFFLCYPELEKRWAKFNLHQRHDLVDTYYKNISAKFGVKTWMGMYGSLSTGVVSYADNEANIAGMHFYQKLFKAYKKGQKSYTFTFSVKDYKITGFNEQNVPNTFDPGLIVNDNK